MNFIWNREDFKRYVRQSLGEPVIRVDVVDTQMENCINDAVDFWSINHYEGTIQTYLKQRVTASEIHLEEALKTPIESSIVIKGEDSGAICETVRYAIGAKSNNSTLFVQDLKLNSFIPGEKIKIADNYYTIKDYKQGIIDEHRIKMPHWILGVVRIIPVNQASSSQNLFDVQYQMRLNDIYDLTSTSLIYYEQAMEHLNLLNFELNAAPGFDFNRHEGYVYPQIKWKYDVSAGDFLIFQVYREVNPKEVPEAWNNPWLRKYATALVKRQWANNLRKYQGIQLPGGATLDGAAMYQEAVQEIRELEEEIYNMIPPSAFLIG